MFEQDSSILYSIGEKKTASLTESKDTEYAWNVRLESEPRVYTHLGFDDLCHAMWRILVLLAVSSKGLKMDHKYSLSKEE